MKKTTFAVVCALLALCALLNTAAFALQEGEWFLPGYTVWDTQSV